MKPQSYQSLVVVNHKELKWHSKDRRAPTTCIAKENKTANRTLLDDKIAFRIHMMPSSSNNLSRPKSPSGFTIQILLLYACGQVLRNTILQAKSLVLCKKLQKGELSICTGTFLQHKGYPPSQTSKLPKN